MDYLVTWNITVEAESPEEAAKLAREIQLDPDSSALFFDVKPQNAFYPVYHIDLSEVA